MIENTIFIENPHFYIDDNGQGIATCEAYIEISGTNDEGENHEENFSGEINFVVDKDGSIFETIEKGLTLGGEIFNWCWDNFENEGEEYANEVIENIGNQLKEALQDEISAFIEDCKAA